MPSEQPAVLIENRQPRSVDVDGLTSLAQTTLQGEGIRSGELSVSFVTADEMSDLHQRYVGEPGPTDVLSFPMDGAGAAPGGREGGPEPLLGDVVICPQVAARNNPDLASELRLLLVHGILHLLGYDHDEAADRAEMWARQERYSGVPGPPPQEGTG